MFFKLSGINLEAILNQELLENFSFNVKQKKKKKSPVNTYDMLRMVIA